MTSQPVIPKNKLILGAIIFISGFASPLLIPLVTKTSWSIGVKTAVSGLLAFGIPEIFMIVAVAVMGKPGYEFLKLKVFGFLKQIAPPDTVSITRYRIGLAFFILPLMVGWFQPYLGYFFPLLKQIPVWLFIIGDIVFISSFFVLGGDFWDKFSGLFKHNVKVCKKG
jgi:hypothetical protein